MARSTKGVDISLTGDKELIAVFNRLPGKVQKKLARKSLRKGAKIIADEAKRLVPVDTGALRKSIKVRSLKRNRKGNIGAQAITGEGFFKGDQYYGGMIEFGTKKMAARPFLRPAADKNEARVMKAIEDGIKEAVNEVMRGS